MDPDYAPISEDGIGAPKPSSATVTTPLKSPPPNDFSMKLVSKVVCDMHIHMIMHTCCSTARKFNGEA